MRGLHRFAVGSMGARWVFVLALSAALAGCSTVSTSSSGTLTSATSTATTAPTPTTAPTASPTAAPAATPTSGPTTPVPEYAGCTGGLFRQAPAMVAAGALSVSAPTRALDYPYTEVPNSAPDAPYAVTSQEQSGYHPKPVVNPSLGVGYVFVICNQTSTAHTLSGLSVTIRGFSPSTGAVREWNPCFGGFYDASSKQVISGGGGGAVEVSDYLSATFSSNVTGATAPVGHFKAATGGTTSVLPPIKIAAKHSISLAVGVYGLNSQGTYTLGFAVSADGGSATTLSPSDGSFLIAPSAVKWTGKNCTTSAMKSKMPSTGYYVCPSA